MTTLTPLAYVEGQPYTELPADLFIPPDALEVLLDSFSGPLDLLLYLIRRQNIDILNIPIALITKQYLQYIQLMEARRLELAADYLVMAAMLAEIKSRLLLPAHVGIEDNIESDPRMELVRKLQAYEQIKQAAIALDELPQLNRDFYRFSLTSMDLEPTIVHPPLDLSQIIQAMSELMKRQSHSIHHRISQEALSVRERMTLVLERLSREKNILFTQLFSAKEGRMGLTVSFLAILELARQALILVSQTQAYGTIYLQAVENE
jgi:segregation and condensation protein A